MASTVISDLGYGQWTATISGLQYDYTAYDSFRYILRKYNDIGEIVTDYESIYNIVYFYNYWQDQDYFLETKAKYQGIWYNTGSAFFTTLEIPAPTISLAQRTSTSLTISRVASVGDLTTYIHWYDELGVGHGWYRVQDSGFSYSNNGVYLTINGLYPGMQYTFKAVASVKENNHGYEGTITGYESSWHSYTTKPKTPTIRLTQKTGQLLQFEVDVTAGRYDTIVSSLYDSSNSLVEVKTVEPIESKYISFANLTSNETYTLLSFSTLDADNTTLYSLNAATTVTMLNRPTAWAWTINENYAFNNNGLFTTLTYERWNQLCDKVKEFLIYSNMHFHVVTPLVQDVNDMVYVGSDIHAINLLELAKMFESDRTLTYRKWNTLGFLTSLCYGFNPYLPPYINIQQYDQCIGGYFVWLEGHINDIP